MQTGQPISGDKYLFSSLISWTLLLIIPGNQITLSKHYFEKPLLFQHLRPEAIPPAALPGCREWVGFALMGQLSLSGSTLSQMPLEDWER